MLVMATSDADNDDAVIPGLPDHVALRCLETLPRSLHYTARCVSKSWREALHPLRIQQVRHQLGITEHWILIFARCQTRRDKTSRELHLLDPDLHRCNAVPLLRKYESLHLVDIGSLLPGHILVMASFDRSTDRPFSTTMCLDIKNRKWRRFSLTFPTLHGELLDATSIHGFVYTVSGCKTVQRLDLATRQWMPLPEMKGEFTMDTSMIASFHSRLVVFRSHGNSESWDPSTCKWSWIPEVWPFRHLPVVAVLNDQLFGIGDDLHLMIYEMERKEWLHIGSVPVNGDGDNDDKSGKLKLVAVGDELWVVSLSSSSNFILITKPTIHPLKWRELPYSNQIESITVVNV